MGTKRGSVLDKLFEDINNKFVTLDCTLAELKGVSIRDNLDFDEILVDVKNNSVILPVLREHWLNAAEIKSQYRKKKKHFGLIDAILVAKQKELKCKLISGDPHFKGLKNVVFLG